MQCRGVMRHEKIVDRFLDIVLVLQGTNNVGVTEIDTFLVQVCL